MKLHMVRSMNLNLSSSFIEIELSGFDDFGRQFDRHGSVANWWQEDTSKEFNTRAKCFLDKVNLQKSL